MNRTLLFAVLPLVASACAEPAVDPVQDNVAAATAMNEVQTNISAPGSAATAQLAAAGGAARGSATLTDTPEGLAVQISAQGLPAGEHGWHVHMVGRCDAPKFESAGGHWNPTNRQHGRDNPQGAHGGDMPNLTAGADGKAASNFTIAGQTLAGLLDTDGAALLIHAKPDDYKTDPSGASGDRIACGVLKAS